jgi:hypothetical protein
MSFGFKALIPKIALVTESKSSGECVPLIICLILFIVETIGHAGGFVASGLHKESDW